MRVFLRYNGKSDSEFFLDLFYLGICGCDCLVVVCGGFHFAFDFDIELDFGLCS